MIDNPYYAKLKTVVTTALAAFEDGKVTMAEVWMFILSLGEAVKTVLAEASDFSDQDLAMLQEAGRQLYEEHVEPLNVPGPDWLVDPLLKNGVLPAAVEAAFRLAKHQAEKSTDAGESDGGDGGDGGE